MNTMSTSQQFYNDLNDFLTKHVSQGQGNITHTRIGSKELNVYGGSYSIPKEELSTFHRLYYEHIFVKGRKEYLTEKQVDPGGPVLVDLDFRYDYNVTTRQHSTGHIQDIIALYLDELKKFFVFEEGKTFPIFVMEKPNVNRVADKNITKDGIHMIIGIQMDHIMQTMLREKVIAKIGHTINDLPLINDWESVLDEGISKGTTNWQMYGSQKPGNECYKITYYMVAELDPVDNEFMTLPKNPKEIDLSKDFYLLSAQCECHVKFDIHPQIMDEYEKKMQTKNKKKTTNRKVNIVFDNEETDIEVSDIKNEETLKKAMENILSSLKVKEQCIRETHEYTQILPKKYYEPGSHLLNRQVAFALKHTDDRLFLSWVMLRSKASDFDYDTIPSLYHEWKNFTRRSDDQCVTRRSIMYWAKQDAFMEYERVKKTTIDYYIEETVGDVGDFDYAMVLYHMFKDKYVCSSIANKKWYVFQQNRWVVDDGYTLRLAISKDLAELYSDKQIHLLSELHQHDENDELYHKIQAKAKKLSNVCIRLKKTNDKNNIMREAMEIFYDKHFTKNMDVNPYLMCFTNGVVDFKNKCFRQGYPQDYITKSTGIPYFPYYEAIKEDKNVEMVEEIKSFMKTLFPMSELYRYMWDHLAASLIGIKKEHAFNIYRGSGSNGKSMLTDLMSHSLGEYKGTVPITLVTEKRNSIGGTSSEVIQLKGVRYAVMQEPSKDAVINEGIMKELTGGDPIQARALWSESETFIPQFSLVVCTNALFEIKSNDDGTWRRLKLVDFVSKFISEGEMHTDDTQYVFPKDKSLKEKLPKMSPIFISMLVDRAFETQGEVKDCPEVVAASNKYRQNQDCIRAFIEEKLMKIQDKTKVNGVIGVGKQSLNTVFKDWFALNYGNRKAPKLLDLEEAIIKKYGKRNLKTNKWDDIMIRQDEEEDEMNELN